MEKSSLRSNKWKLKKERGFTTETLTTSEIEEILSGSEDYAEGKSLSSRNTQFAEELEDLVELQRQTHDKDRMSMTQNLGPAPARPIEDFTYDGNREESTEEPSEEADELVPVKISPEDENYEDIMETFQANPSKPQYYFEEHGDFWICSCGKTNKGDRCSSCGLERDLLRSLYILHKPGENPGEYDGMPIKYEEVQIPSGRLSGKQKLIAVIAAVAVLAVCGGLFSYFYAIKPAIDKNEAERVEDISTAIEAGVTGALNADTVTPLFDAYVAAGDSAYENKKYEDAISFYSSALKIKDSDKVSGKIEKSKFGYVSANVSKGGSTFEKYLDELKKSGYEGIDEIYDKYYAWSFKVIANLAAEDFTGDISMAGRSDIIYFHVLVSGGPPGETKNVYYEASWPNGSKEIADIGSGWKDGSRGTARLSSAVPMFMKEGSLVFSIYDKNSQEKLGSKTVTLRK